MPFILYLCLLFPSFCNVPFQLMDCHSQPCDGISVVLIFSFVLPVISIMYPLCKWAYMCGWYSVALVFITRSTIFVTRRTNSDIITIAPKERDL